MRAGAGMRWVFALWAASFMAVALAQGPLRPLPPVLRTVSDEARVLSDEQGRKLASALADLYTETRVPVVVLIADTTRPEKIEDYGERLAKLWFDERGLDPTRTIFIIISRKEREMVVMPGHALRLSQALHRENPTAPVAAFFREERYFEGLMVLIDGLGEVLRRNLGKE